MATTQHLVELGPDAVELVDQTMLELAAEIPQFQEKLKRFVKGKSRITAAGRVRWSGI